MKKDDSFFRLVRNFLTIHLPKHRCYSQNTIKAYRDTINLYRIFFQEQKKLSFPQITFESFNHDLMYEFLTWLQDTRKCSLSTCNHRLTVLKAFLYYCAMEEPSLMAVYMKLKTVPAFRISRSSVKYMTELALKALLEQPDSHTRCGKRDKFFMILLYDSGARIQEILDLKLKDLHLQADIPCVYLTGKGNKTRAVPLLEKTIAHLLEYLKHFHSMTARDNEDYLFYATSTCRRGRMSEDNVACFLKKYGNSARERCPEVPLRIYPHLFRHTRAMHLYQSGIPLSYIKDFLGHVSINTTDIYASADTAMMRDALEKVSEKSPLHQGNHEIPIWKDNDEMILKLCGLK
jgi:integrase/recombinase XerD